MQILGAGKGIGSAFINQSWLLFPICKSSLVFTASTAAWVSKGECREQAFNCCVLQIVMTAVTQWVDWAWRVDRKLVVAIGVAQLLSFLLCITGTLECVFKWSQGWYTWNPGFCCSLKALHNLCTSISLCRCYIRDTWWKGHQCSRNTITHQLWTTGYYLQLSTFQTVTMEMEDDEPLVYLPAVSSSWRWSELRGYQGMIYLLDKNIHFNWWCLQFWPYSRAAWLLRKSRPVCMHMVCRVWRESCNAEYSWGQVLYFTSNAFHVLTWVCALVVFTSCMLIWCAIPARILPILVWCWERYCTSFQNETHTSTQGVVPVVCFTWSHQARRIVSLSYIACNSFPSFIPASVTSTCLLKTYGVCVYTLLFRRISTPVSHQWLCWTVSLSLLSWCCHIWSSGKVEANRILILTWTSLLHPSQHFVFISSSLSCWTCSMLPSNNSRWYRR